MEASHSRLSGLGLAFTLLLLPAALGEAEEGWGGRFSLELEPEASLVSRLLLRAPGWSLRLSSEAEDEGFVLRLGLEAGAAWAGGEDWEGGAVLAGPGRVIGAFRLLDNPLSLSRGLGVGRRAFELDSSLEAGASLLGLDLGRAACFGLLRGGGGGGFLAGRGGLGSESPGGEGGFGRSSPEDWDSGAGGFLLRFPGSAGLELGLLGCIGFDRGREGGGGWAPEPRPRPAELSAGLGLLLEGKLEKSSARLGLAWSQGRLAGPGLALRLEAESSGGRLSSKVFAAAASPSYRDLEGGPPSGLGVGGLDLGLALFRAARLGLRSRLESPSALGLRLPALSRSLAAELSLPLFAALPRRLSLEGRLERDEEGSARILRAELEGGSSVGSWSLSLEKEFGAATEVEDGAGGDPLALFLSASTRSRGGIFSAMGRLGLEFPGEDETPRGELAVELGLGLPAGGSLELRLRFEAVELSPLAPEEAGPRPLLGLGYGRDLGPKGARP